MLYQTTALADCTTNRNCTQDNLTIVQQKGKVELLLPKQETVHRTREQIHEAPTIYLTLRKISRATIMVVGSVPNGLSGVSGVLDQLGMYTDSKTHDL